MTVEQQVERLRRGMWIEGKRTLPAEIRLLRTTGRGRESGNTWWEVVLRQGLVKLPRAEKLRWFLRR